MSREMHQLPLSDRIRSARFAPAQEAALVELAERVEEATTVEEIIRRARSPYIPAPRAATNDRHGLHAVPRTVGPAAVLGGLAAAAHWVGRTRLHKAVATAATITLASGAALTPSVVAHGAAQAPSAHGHHAHHHALTVLPPGMQPPPAARRRRRPHQQQHQQQHAQPSPLPTPKISFTPLASPSPSPSPSMSSSPPPSPQAGPSPSPSVSATPSSASSSPAPPGPTTGMPSMPASTGGSP